MSTNIVTDQSKNVLWNARQGDDQSILINFLDSLAAYDISGEEFTVLIRKFSGGNMLTLEEGDGITNGGTDGTLLIDFTNEDLDITADVYLLLLKSTNSSTGKIRTWLNGTFILNSEQWDGDATEEETINVAIGDIILNLNITLAGGGGGGGSDNPQYLGDWTTLESGFFPQDGVGSGDGGARRLGDQWRLVFSSQDTPKIIATIPYYHNTIIEYASLGRWNSWGINNGAES